MELIEFLRRLGTRAITEQVFARAGVRPRTVAETATNMAAIELVREGLGVTLLEPVSGSVGRDAQHYRQTLRRPNHVQHQLRAALRPSAVRARAAIHGIRQGDHTSG